MNYFSRVSIDPNSVNANRLAQEMCANGYREHQHLWRLFETDPDAKRDFLFRREKSNGGFPRFYLLSDRLPQHDDGVWQIETKEYRPVILRGQRLAFTLRANPVVTRRDESGRQHRHDVVMDLKHRTGYKKLSISERTPLTNIIEEAGLAWLQSRAEKNGFSFRKGDVGVEGYDQHRAVKNTRGTPIRYSTLDYAGLLTVEDADLFQQALMNGIGRSKAFGCGLLLVRRVLDSMS